MSETPDWTNIAAVQNEWDVDSTSQDADLAAWAEGMHLYETDDDRVLLQASELMCRALRYSLFGADILVAGDLLETVRRVLYATATSATEIKEMRTDTARCMRLALMICKMHGWQHVNYGGDGRMAELLDAYGLIYPLCVGAPRVTMGDFFRINAIPQTDEPGPDPLHHQTPLENLEKTLADAEAGDPASEARAHALAMQFEGCSPQEALALHEKAATLGDVGSMYDAGCLARDLGLRAQAIYWWELAATQNHEKAAINLSVLHREEGDLTQAMSWMEKAGVAGYADSYAELVMLARMAGDEEREFLYAQSGARAGHWFCCERYAQMLVVRGADAPTLRDTVLPLFERAADTGGSPIAMYCAGLVYLDLNEPSKASLWLRRAADAGEERAPGKLRELGL